jgi:hypothetical protein
MTPFQVVRNLQYCFACLKALVVQSISITMAPSSGGNAADQSMGTKLIVGIDCGTTYSGMRKSATLSL